MSFTGTEAAGFSAVATNFKNFGVTHEDWMSTIIICIITLLILKIAQRFTSGQGMGIFMKALGQMITGVIQTLGAVVTGGAKAAEMAAPLAGAAMGAAGGMVGGALQATGLDKPINRAAEGLQGAMNNVTQGLSGVMDKIGSGISGFVQQSVQTVQNLPITQRVMEFQQGMRDLAAGITSSDFAQGVARVVMPGVAVLTFATKNVALPVAGFVGREILLPAAGAAVQQGAAFAFNTLTDDMFKDVNLAGELQNVRENLAKAPLSEAPARDAAAPAGEQQAGLVRVQNTADVTTAERQATNNYQRLGLEEGATFDEVRKAYRDLAMQYHPDRNLNQTEQEKRGFQEITAAYNVIRGQRDGFVPREGVGAVSQGPTSDTTRQLSGTTFAAMPEQKETRSELKGIRSLDDYSNKQNSEEEEEQDQDQREANKKEAAMRSAFEDASKKGTPEEKSRAKAEKEKKRVEQKAADLASRYGLDDKEIILRAGGDTASNAALESTARYLSDLKEQKKAKSKIVRFKRATTSVPTGPKSRK